MNSSTPAAEVSFYLALKYDSLHKTTGKARILTTNYAKRCSKKNGSFEVKEHKYAGNARKAGVIAPAARARAAFMAVY